MLTNEEQQELNNILRIYERNPLAIISQYKDRKIELENKAKIGQYKDFYIETAKQDFLELVPRYVHNPGMLKLELENLLQKVANIKKEQLNFVSLRSANEETVGQFKNKRGEGFVTPHRSEWDANAWMVNLVGEVGKASKVLTNVNRGNYSLLEARRGLADELADVQIALDLLAAHIGIDLGEATRNKFNETMIKLGIKCKI